MRSLIQPRFLALAVWALCAANTGSAQTAFPFQLRIQQAGNVTVIPNSSTLNLVAGNIGQLVTVRFTAVYRGTSRATISLQPELFGAVEFTAAPLAHLPASLAPGDGITTDIQFRPTAARRVSAQFSVTFVEQPPSGSPPGTLPQTGFITIGLAGSAPDFQLSYFLSQDANIIPLTPGIRLAFAPTLLNTTAVAGVIITNRGSGPGPITAITVTGPEFQAVGLPLLPATLDAGESLRFSIRYAPRQIESSAGTLRVAFGEREVVVPIQGSATGSNFAYEVLTDDKTRVIQPDDSFSLPDTPVGDTASVAMRIRNTGNSDGPVTSINLIGAGFQLTDVPFLPQVLAPNASLVFTLTFAPTKAGVARGRLRIGNDSFEVAATGIGPRLLFSYVRAGTAVNLTPAGAVVFSPLEVGQTSRIDFVIRNAGTAAAPIASLGVVEQRSPFSLAGLPQLPATLDPDASIRFAIVFIPATTGFVNATLRVDALTFALSGVATPPPALSAYRFEGVSGAVEPLAQPALRLTLVSPYPMALTGTLTLSINAETSPGDPAVQFATGGRTASFSIAANATEALFSGDARELRLQTGTVGGTILIAPSFALQSGLNLTPDPAPPLRLTVNPSAPRLTGVQILSRAPGGFVLSVTGFATTRSLTRLDLQFTAAQGFSLPGARFTINVESDAGAWFRGLQSQAFGGQFTAQIPFTLRSDQTSVSSPVDALESVSVTATNERGTSAAATTGFR